MRNRDELDDLELDIEEEIEEEAQRVPDPFLNRLSKWLLQFPFVVRVGILFSSVGFFLAFFVGLFSGVSIWTLLFKTFLGSLFFFFLGLVIAYVLVQFLGKDFFETVGSQGVEGETALAEKARQEIENRRIEEIGKREYEDEGDEEDAGEAEDAEEAKKENAVLGSKVDYWESDNADLKDLNSSLDMSKSGMKGFEKKSPEKNFPDDPKQLAQAVKTIYLRDKTE